MAAIAQRPPMIIRQTATAASDDSEMLFRLRRNIMLSGKFMLSPTASSLTDQDEVFPIQIEADFPEPRTIPQIANQHRRFVASMSKQNYEVELLDDPA